MGLKHIVGHERPLNILKGYIRKGRIPHALLFAGEEGVGKRHTATMFAKLLNCKENAGLFSNTSRQSSHDPDSCDACSSCVKVERAVHPDVMVIGPEGDGGQITVSSVRSLQESMAYRPFEGIWKIAIINDAEIMNSAAQNAFLETLEEPPHQSILILVSSRPDTLLSTIRSRCHRVNFSPLPLREMGELLQRTMKEIDEKRSLLLSTLSGGRFGYAMHEDLLSRREKSFGELGQMMSNTDTEAWADRESMDEWFEWCQLWLRDMAVLRATGKTNLLINEDKESDIRELTRQAGLWEILNLSRELERVRSNLHVSLNKQLTLNYTGILLRNTLAR